MAPIRTKAVKLTDAQAFLLGRLYCGPVEVELGDRVARALVDKDMATSDSGSAAFYRLCSITDAGRAEHDRRTATKRSRSNQAVADLGVDYKKIAADLLDAFVLPGRNLDDVWQNACMKLGRFCSPFLEGCPRPRLPDDCPRYGYYCTDHEFVHGAEAEELRSGVEEILSGLDSGKMPRWAVRLQALLDEVNARDSLAFRARNDELALKRTGSPEQPPADTSNCMICRERPTTGFMCAECGNAWDRHNSDSPNTIADAMSWASRRTLAFERRRAKKDRWVAERTRPEGKSRVR